MLNKTEILKLDDNREYAIVSSQIYDNKNYVYLVDIDDHTNFMFCIYDNDDKLEKIIDKELIQKLIIVFGKDLLEKK